MLKIPTIKGVIRRRFLINFRIDVEVMRKVLPEPFEPQLHNGYGIAGICLIRLENIRPKISPVSCGISSENAAHRFAVLHEGEPAVYIPRRDTDSLLNQLAGGRVFPGVHHAATFDVSQSGGQYAMEMKAKDGSTEIRFSGEVADRFPESSCFSSIEEASRFFELGSLGYSDAHQEQRYDAIRLETQDWEVKAFAIEQVYSSYFADESVFPAGSVEFDHALFMEDIPHEWNQEDDLCCS